MNSVIRREKFEESKYKTKDGQAIKVSRDMNKAKKKMNKQRIVFTDLLTSF